MNEWVDRHDGTVSCPVCGMVYDYVIDALRFNFCPKCGTPIKNEDKEQ